MSLRKKISTWTSEVSQEKMSEILCCLKCIWINSWMWNWFYWWFYRDWHTIQWLKKNWNTCWQLWQPQCPPISWECNWCDQWLYQYNWTCVDSCPPWYEPDNCNNCIKVNNWCWWFNQKPCNWICNDWLYNYNWTCVLWCPAWYQTIDWQCVLVNQQPIAPAIWTWQSIDNPIRLLNNWPIDDLVNTLIDFPFVDPEGTAIKYQVKNLPAWLTFDYSTQKITGSIASAWDYNGEIKACDTSSNCTDWLPICFHVI
jgi:hypothetical protein